MDTQELGGNILLTGFSSCDGGTMIILKKIIGNYAKTIAESSVDFEKLHITLNQKDARFDVEAVVKYGGQSLSSLSSEQNIFVGVDQALKNIVKQN